jgi:hypothetical protein
MQGTGQGFYKLQAVRESTRSRLRRREGVWGFYFFFLISRVVRVRDDIHVILCISAAPFLSTSL